MLFCFDCKIHRLSCHFSSYNVLYSPYLLTFSCFFRSQSLIRLLFRHCTFNPSSVAKLVAEADEDLSFTFFHVYFVAVPNESADQWYLNRCTFRDYFTLLRYFAETSQKALMGAIRHDNIVWAFRCITCRYTLDRYKEVPLIRACKYG